MQRANQNLFTAENVESAEKTLRKIQSPFSFVLGVLRELGGKPLAYRRANFSGRWNISTAADSFSARRFCPCSYAAPTNVLNSGWGSSGLDLNSGWNWHPMKCGWLGSSTIST